MSQQPLNDPRRRARRRLPAVRALLPLLLLAAVACGGRRVQLNTLSADALFERGMTKMQERDWDDAVSAFQQFSFQHPGDPRIQEARYLLAESYFGKKEFVTAANEYARLADDYPTGDWADDARFKVCESYFRLSPDVELDQEYTQAAIDHCESLIGYHPDSPFVPRAADIIDAMREKLAQKVFTSAEYYFKRNAFDSAIIYFEQVVANHPRSDLAPRALLRIVEAYERIGYEEEAEEARQRLLTAYPDSEAARAAQAVDATPS